MSKKTIILISVILGIFLICLVGYYFIIQNNTPGSSGPVSVFKNFYPFGGNNSTEPTPQTSTTTQPTQTQNSNTKDFTKKLRLLSQEPVSGAGTMDVKAGTIVRYIEKATGHIFEVELFSPKQNRISNVTIPLVYDAVWGNGNNSLLARYLRDDNQTIDTYAITVKEVSTTTQNTISGTKLQQNISDLGSFGTDYFYLVQNDNSSNGYISDWAGKKTKQVWSSDIKELLSQFVNPKLVSLTTKPAQGITGFMYFIDTTLVKTTKTLEGDGLSTLVNPDGTAVLYITQSDNIIMSILDVKSKIKTQITPTTFPEKCVWGKKDKNFIYCAVPKVLVDGSSLTKWYQGLISFSDDIWKYDLKNNTSSLIENLSSDSGTQIDVYKPIISDNDQYLVFMNKIDNSLWNLDLTK